MGNREQLDGSHLKVIHQPHSRIWQRRRPMLTCSSCCCSYSTNLLCNCYRVTIVFGSIMISITTWYWAHGQIAEVSSRSHLAPTADLQWCLYSKEELVDISQSEPSCMTHVCQIHSALCCMCTCNMGCFVQPLHVWWKCHLVLKPEFVHMSTSLMIALLLPHIIWMHLLV